MRVLGQNKQLEKLAMQHNRFGDGDFKEFSKELAKHPSLTYLDISQNRLHCKPFVKIFSAIQSNECRVRTFHCRKNLIGGSKIDDVLNNRSNHLQVLDLSRNRLNDTNGLALESYARENVSIERITLDKNMEVSASITNAIEDECRQNILMKKKILSRLRLAEHTGYQHSVYGDESYKLYDTSELVLENQRLDHFDFVGKFL